jgi:histone H3/H4
MAETAPIAPVVKSSDDKSLVVKSAVGDYIRAKSLKVSSDLYDALSASIKELLDAACKRCEGNGRKTVMTQDV